jgi:hypothetical protein
LCRWDVVANFIEEHSRGKFKRTGKEVLTKTKELDKGLILSLFFLNLNKKIIFLKIQKLKMK